MTETPQPGFYVSEAAAHLLAKKDTAPEPQTDDPFDHRPLRVVGPNSPLAIRRLKLTPATSYQIARVRWVMEGRIALGTLALLAGREGLGKSTIAYWIAARITRGELEGEFHGQPRSVLVCATEDSWSHTIVPRLIAAGADLSKVFNVEVSDDVTHVSLGLTLPVDVDALRDAALESDSALLILDPLMSRLSGKLDSHKDAEVRQALEPLTKMADDARMAVLGLIHLNKSGNQDPLNQVMGSKAFAAVARSVCMVTPDANDPADQRRFFGTPKNNLGPTNLPIKPYTVAAQPIETANDGMAWTGRIEWEDDIEGSMRDLMEAGSQDSETKSLVDEAGDWLEDYLALEGGSAVRKDVVREGAKAGHKEHNLRRAMKARPTIGTRSNGTMPRTLTYFLTADKPAAVVTEDEGPVVTRAGGLVTTVTTVTTGADLRKQGETSEESLFPLVVTDVTDVTAPPARVTTEPDWSFIPEPTDDDEPPEDY